MDLSLSSSTFPDDFPNLPVICPDNSPPKPRDGFSLDLEAPPPPPSNVNGYFYNLLHSRDTDVLEDDHGFTIEGSSSNPFSQVVSTPQLDPPAYYPCLDPHATATFHRGFDLSLTPPPPPPSSPPPPSVDTLPQSGDRNGVAAHGELELKSFFDYNPVDHHRYQDPVTVDGQNTPLLNLNDLGSPSNGVAAHGELELKSFFDYNPVDHHRYHDPVTVDGQNTPLLDLSDLGSLNKRLGEEFPSSGVSSDRQWVHEQDDGGDDRNKREVVIALPQQQLKQTKGKKKSESEDDKEPLVVKGQWTLEEDSLLTSLVEEHGTKRWSQIAQKMKGRVGKQCRERWHNHLRPDIKKDLWSIEEDKILIQAHQQIGNKWAEIAKRLPGRSENTIKNHWNATKRRQSSKRNLLSNINNSDILQNYIRSVTGPSPPQQSAPAVGLNHDNRHCLEIENRSLSLSAAAIPNGLDMQPGAANSGQQALDHHHLHQSPLPAQRPGSSYFGFPMVDGNVNLGLYQLDAHPYHQGLSEGGGNGSEGRSNNELELELAMSLQTDGERLRRHHGHQHHNDHQRRETKELDLLEMLARRSG